MITLRAMQYEPIEWSIDGGTDPSREIDAVITGPSGTYRVPAFWSGDAEWRIRFAATQPGDYNWHSECSGADCRELQSIEGEITVDAYTGHNPLLAHGPISISDDRRHFRHQDGTPFFWFGDTWWMGFTERLSWPDGFEELAADRVAKGFTLIQIVAGVYPDMPYGDPRGENEAGLPYDESLRTPNPAWWDLADLKVRALVRKGLLPCIVGCWGYYSTVFGVEKIKRHWRHIIARWGAYPVIWCLAGEGAMPYYQSATKEADEANQRSAWTDIAHYVREMDPMHRLITIHPTDAGRAQVDDDTVLDFDMLQTGHNGKTAIGNSVRLVTESRAKEPAMPVVVSEVIYEGIMHESDAEKLRLVFWASMLSGSAGFTYGANGIWQLNEENRPYGPSPHGGTWGNTPWREAAQLPGSKQLGLCARFLASFDWQRMECHPEWIDPPAAEGDYYAWYAAGVPGQFRIVYLYDLILPWAKGSRPRLTGLEADRVWFARWFDPRTGAQTEIGRIVPDANGNWGIPVTPEMKDYVFVLEVPRDSTSTP